MKAKVLMYKADQNTLCTKVVELEKVTDHVYKMPIKDCDSISKIVFDVKGVLFTWMTMANGIMEDYKNRLESDCVNFVDKIRKAAKDGEYIRNIDIRVLESLGLNTEDLIKSREVFKERKRQEEEEYWKRAKELADKLEMERIEGLKKLDEAFSNGEWVDVEDFLSLCDWKGVKIHPRTKHVFDNNVTKVSKDRGVMFRRYVGERKPNFAGCHNTIEKYSNQ